MRNAWWQQGYRFFTGREEHDAAVVLHHRTALHGSPCDACGRPLRTPFARVCVSCGHRRPHGPAAASSHQTCVLRLRPDVAPTTVRDALRVPGDEFLDALVDVMIPERLRDAGDEHQPERVRMVAGITRVWMLMETEGSVNYLGNGTPTELADVIGWCEELAAHRCAEYLRALEALFPVDARMNDAAWEARLWELADAEGAPLDALDRAYCDVIPELPDRMRAFVAAHQSEFEDATAAYDLATATGRHGTGTGHFPGAFDYIEQSRALAEALERQHPSLRRAGQVIALATPGGARYFQVVLDHGLQSTIGYVVHALASPPVGRDLDAALLADTRRGAPLLIDASVFARPGVTIVGTAPVPTDGIAFRYPLGEDAGGVCWWGVWRGGATTVDRWPDPLTPEQEAVPAMDTLTAEQLFESA
jgi:hypothetical protein